MLSDVDILEVSAAKKLVTDPGTQEKSKCQLEVQRNLAVCY